MTKITHPSMRRVRDSSVQNSPQTFVVEDSSENYNVPEPNTQPQEYKENVEVDDIDEKLKQFETSSKTHAETSNQTQHSSQTKAPAKKTLESLLFAGKVEREFEFANNKYKMSTLTNKEYNLVIKELYHFGDAAELFVIKTLTLALALKSINGTSLDDIEIDGTFDSDLYRRKEIIDNLQTSVVEKLYELYSGMVEESDKLVSGEELKKS